MTQNQCILCLETNSRVRLVENFYNCNCRFYVHQDCFQNYQQHFSHCMYCRQQSSAPRLQCVFCLVVDSQVVNINNGCGCEYSAHTHCSQEYQGNFERCLNCNQRFRNPRSIRNNTFTQDCIRLVRVLENLNINHRNFRSLVQDNNVTNNINIIHNDIRNLLNLFENENFFIHENLNIINSNENQSIIN